MKLYSYGLFVGLIASKFFYLSLFTLDGFGFTLSDLCLVLMTVDIFIGYFADRGDGLSRKCLQRKSVARYYVNLLAVSVMALVMQLAGTLLAEMSIANAILIYIKRWLSIVLLPLFMYLRFEKRDFIPLIRLIFIIVGVFCAVNYNEIMNSLNIDRFFYTMNPNVLGMFISVAIILIMFYKGLFTTAPVLYVLSMCVYFVLLIVVASRGALFALIPVIVYGLYEQNRWKLTAKRVLGFAVLLCAVVALGPVINNLFSYSMHRISDTLERGILSDVNLLSRFATQKIGVMVLLGDLSALFFGVGFGNTTPYFSRSGYFIETADSQYVDLLIWGGLISVVIFAMVVVGIMRRAKKEKTFLSNLVVYSTWYMLLAGITQDSFMEPTITVIYFVVLGFYEASKKGAESDIAATQTSTQNLCSMRQ